MFAGPEPEDPESEEPELPPDDPLLLGLYTTGSETVIFDSKVLPPADTVSVVSPAATVIPAGGKAVIPTGIRCEMREGWVLMLFPRSGLGFRHQTRLSNTVGIIDSDYAFAENEGHILVSLRNPLDRELVIGRGERFCQGIFLHYGLAEEEDEFAERRGGFGSTGR